MKKMMLASLSLFFISQSNLAEARPFYPILCRGGYKVKLETGDSNKFIIEFKHAKTAAGETGASLGVGECAFKDRPFHWNEPKTMVILRPDIMVCENDPKDIHCKIRNSDDSRIKTQMAQDCALNEKCILNADMTNVHGEFWPGHNISIQRLN
jgi:hypothetical protein